MKKIKKDNAFQNMHLGTGSINTEQLRLTKKAWKKWGPYVSNRQWGTVREDYSANGDAWNFVTHDMARSKTYRWGEEGIAGICDEHQLLCFSVALWNKKDPILKEIFFGLSNEQGNHGEDVKELYYYLDATPVHSYMKMLYKYPQNEFPYEWLVNENKKRTRSEPEFELTDTGIFNKDEYFDVFIEYAKAAETDILIKITVSNRSEKEAALNILPMLWFRNTWNWGYDEYKPALLSSNDSNIIINHKILGDYTLYIEEPTEILFCENETNLQRLYNVANKSGYTKDGINDYILHNKKNAVNIAATGTKAAINYDAFIKAKQSSTFNLRLSATLHAHPFRDFDNIFSARIHDADKFYHNIQKGIKSKDACMVQRQAFAGMLWNKQFYYYD
ncbi:MAG: glucosidase, partial [Parafilimonas sp.]